MQLVERHIIKQSNPCFKELDDMAFMSKNLYNATLYQVRQHFFATRTMLDYVELQQQFQDNDQFDYRNLPTKVAQATMKMVFQNFKAFFKALKDYKKHPEKYEARPKIPHYLPKKKGRYLLTFTQQAISKRELVLRGLVHPSGTNLHIPTSLCFEDIAQVRIVKRSGCYVAEIIYNVTLPELKRNNRRYAAIDLGLDNLATVVSNTKELKPLVVSGKRLKSFNHKYNKDLASAKSILETRNGFKSSKRTSQMTFKRNCRVDDYLHKASRYVVNQLQASNINTLIIGNNKGWKQDINIGAVNNQNFVQIPHARFISMLEYKCALCGIDVIVTEESYTSKASFLDRDRIPTYDPNNPKEHTFSGKRIHRGLYRASDGRLINADVNGAYNILRKCKPKAFKADGVRGVVVHPVLIKSIN